MTKDGTRPSIFVALLIGSLAAGLFVVAPASARVLRVGTFHGGKGQYRTVQSAGDAARKGDWVLRILRETGGVAGQAEDEEILAAQSLLARTEGIWAGPTGVAALAVLKNLLHEKEVDPAATICVILSETGLKTEAAPPSRPAIAFDEASLRSLVRES